MKPCLAVAAAMIAGVVGLAWAGVHEIPLDISPERVESPLRVSLKQIGTMEPRTIYDVKSSNWTIGCEGLDRDFANFWECAEFLEPLGIRNVRLQTGGASRLSRPRAIRS